MANTKLRNEPKRAKITQNKPKWPYRKHKASQNEEKTTQKSQNKPKGHLKRAKTSQYNTKQAKKKQERCQKETTNELKWPKMGPKQAKMSQ